MAKRKSAWVAVPTVVDGIRFASKAEAKRYGELKLLERAGEVSDIKCHTRHNLYIGDRPILIRSDGFPNGRVATYTDDFSYFEKGVEGRVIEDVKGRDTGQMRFRRAVFEAMTGKTIRLIR